MWSAWYLILAPLAVWVQIGIPPYFEFVNEVNKLQVSFILTQWSFPGISLLLFGIISGVWPSDLCTLLTPKTWQHGLSHSTGTCTWSLIAWPWSHPVLEAFIYWLLLCSGHLKNLGMKEIYLIIIQGVNGFQEHLVPFKLVCSFSTWSLPA